MSLALLAGASRVDVTPRTRAHLAGHASRTSPSEGIASPLAVRALALADGDQRVLLAVADALWWPPEREHEIRAGVGAELGLPPDSVILHATHTHSAPQPSNAFAPTLGPTDPAFLDSLSEAVLHADRAAFERLEPVTGEHGCAHEQVGVHRRKIVDGIVRMAPDPTIQIDDRVRVVQLRAGNRVVATLVHHACHPTTTGENLISSDYPGALARRCDATHGGTTLVLQGCAGDVRPALVTAGGAFRLGQESDVEVVSERLLAAVERALLASAPLTPVPLHITASKIGLTLESGTRVPLSMVSLTAAQNWHIIGLACEPVGRYQAAAPEAWVLGYTNGMVGYLPTTDQRHAGGYEPLGSLPRFRLDSPFDGQTEPPVVSALVQAARP